MARHASTYRGARRNATIHHEDPQARTSWLAARRLLANPWAPAKDVPGLRNGLGRIRQRQRAQRAADADANPVAAGNTTIASPP